jgi:hypothetical protein
MTVDRHVADIQPRAGRSVEAVADERGAPAILGGGTPDPRSPGFGRVRLSVGCEDAADLLADLAQTLDRTATA